MTDPPAEPAKPAEDAKPAEPAGSVAPDVPPPAFEGLTSPVGAPPSLTERHPEVLVGAAFVGGLIFAHLIRRRGD